MSSRSAPRRSKSKSETKKPTKSKGKTKTRQKARGGSRSAAVPRAIREQVLRRLEPEQRRYLTAGVALAIEFTFKGEYLFIEAKQAGGWLSSTIQSVPLCRLGYTGDPDRWRFEIFHFSRDRYDEEQDFPFGGGTPEECFAVAADFYLLEYDAFEAGSSRHEDAEGQEEEFLGEARLLPPRDRPDAAWPPEEVPEEVREEIREGIREEVREGVPEIAAKAGLPLLADMEAFLGFVEGRTIDLAPRTCGFRRQELVEINGMMEHPASLHKRPVQSDAPRVQCCFAVAEALGLLRVTRTLHRAESTGLARYRAMEVRQQWWALLEAMWQRVRWSALRLRAYGDVEGLQAGRVWLGAELARRTEPLEFDLRLTLDAEVLEVFLLPFWCDAGLLSLTFSRTRRRRDGFEKRATGLWRVEPTDLGRWAFKRLSRIASGHQRLDELAQDTDGRWPGRELLMIARSTGLDLRFDP